MVNVTASYTPKHFLLDALNNYYTFSLMRPSGAGGKARGEAEGAPALAPLMFSDNVPLFSQNPLNVKY